MIEFLLLGMMVMCSAGAVDFAHARYVRAITARPRRRLAAAGWSAAQGAAASVGFVAAVTFSLWLIPFELAGLALGTYVGSRGD